VDMVRWYVVKMFDRQKADGRTLERKRLDVRKRKGVCTAKRVSIWYMC
jgi:hypothetical protein